MFVIEVDGLKLAHLGDLGTILSADQTQQVGPIDVLLLPVGGDGFTIDAALATQVVQQLNPKIVIPMHYKTARSLYPKNSEAAFLEGKRVERPGKSSLIIDKASLPAATTVYVLNFE